MINNWGLIKIWMKRTTVTIFWQYIRQKNIKRVPITNLDNLYRSCYLFAVSISRLRLHYLFIHPLYDPVFLFWFFLFQQSSFLFSSLAQGCKLQSMKLSMTSCKFMTESWSWLRILPCEIWAVKKFRSSWRSSIYEHKKVHMRPDQSSNSRIPCVVFLRSTVKSPSNLCSYKIKTTDFAGWHFSVSKTKIQNNF